MKWLPINEKILIDKEIQLINVDGRKVCLIKYEGRYFATDFKCPHAGADISQGWCEEGYLVCPFHRYKYNLTTGRGVPGQGDYIETYPIEVRNDGIYIQLSGNWFKRLFNF